MPAETTPSQQLTAEAAQQAVRDTDKIAGRIRARNCALTLPPSSINTLESCVNFSSPFRDEFAADCPLQRRVNCELVLRQVALAASTKNISPIEMSWLSLSAYQRSV